ncbi:hypothetical protein AB0D97_14125 [Streptomyces roseus]
MTLEEHARAIEAAIQAAADDGFELDSHGERPYLELQADEPWAWIELRVP